MEWDNLQIYSRESSRRTRYRCGPRSRMVHASVSMVCVSLSSDLSSLILTMVYAPLIMAWSAAAYDVYAYGLIFLWPKVYASVA